MNFEIMNKVDISIIESTLFNKQGDIQILPAKEIKKFPHNALRQFCTKHGIYVVPTTELIEWLLIKIGPLKKKCIEVGAGNGAIAKAMGIIATDSFLQERPDIKKYYTAMGQGIVRYGKDVKNFDAIKAIKKFKPHVVLGCYISNKWYPGDTKGNMFGIDERNILKRVKKYIHIGNAQLHSDKRILSKKHLELRFPWLITRHKDQNENCIWIWGNNEDKKKRHYNL